MKMNCEIIQDLLPSYVEDICSESTRKCVEEHIAGCDECRQMVEAYRNNDFSANSLEKKQLDGFKKIKNKIKLQNVLFIGLFIAFIVFGVYAMEFSYNPLPEMAYYILFSFLIIGVNVAFQNENKEKWSKGSILRIIASAMLIVYGMSMLILVILSVIQGNNMFGMSDADIGPFIHINTGMVLVLEALIMGYELYLYVCKSKLSKWIMNINITGCFLLLTHMSLLRRLSDLETYFMSFARITIVIMIISVLGVCVGCVFKKKE